VQVEGTLEAAVQAAVQAAEAEEVEE
jgi:hypothetical protein